ncbi:hypothetical protein YB2330_002086 [Saitoella coloradoensis]
MTVIDLTSYRHNPTSTQAVAECEKLYAALQAYSACIISDDRVNPSDNDAFLNMLEKYSEQDDAVKAQDARPDLSFQCGATPAGTEVSRCSSKGVKANQKCETAINALHPSEHPLQQTGPDPKWRYMWRMGTPPPSTCSSKFAALNSGHIIPAGFPEWERTMNAWGSTLHSAVSTVAEMIGDAMMGSGKGAEKLRSITQYGPHLLAPTMVDLERHGEEGAVYAGFHQDISLLTIHGKSRFPGLYIWVDGRRVAVRVPDGMLLLQAGMQLERISAGEIRAGWHEVVCTPSTLEAVRKAKEEESSVHRVSSTLFFHVESDKWLEDLNERAGAEKKEGFERMLAGEFVAAELSDIGLSKAEAEIVP